MHRILSSGGKKCGRLHECLITCYVTQKLNFKFKEYMPRGHDYLCSALPATIVRVFNFLFMRMFVHVDEQQERLFKKYEIYPTYDGRRVDIVIKYACVKKENK